MKLLTMLCGVSILFLLLVSCEKDLENNPNKNIVGTWKLTDILADDGVRVFQSFKGTGVISFIMHGLDFNTTTTFTENPNEFTSTGNYTTVTIFDNGVSDTIFVPALDSVGTWSIEGSILTQIMAGDTTALNILELSNSKLKISHSINSAFGSPHVVLVHDTATVYSSFEKL